MNKEFSPKLKHAWIASNLALIVLPLLLFPLGFENAAGVCLTALILLSYPCNMLAGWLFFAYGLFDPSISSLFLLMIVFSSLGYFQWFVLVPQIMKMAHQQIKLIERLFEKDEA